MMRKIPSLFIILLMSIAAMAQKRTITGKVTSADEEKPLAGVTVKLKGTNAIVSTNNDGQYSISVTDGNSVLVFSYVGYTLKEIKVGSLASIDVKLEPEASTLNDVVVVGYTTQKKELLTTAVSSMKMTDDLAQVPTTSLGNLLTGKMAGVNTNNPDGILGNQTNITIRVKSSTNPQPVLYVIDGMISSQADFNNLSANDIDDISVLKDAAAASVYGSRASGGVMVVTTKRGNFSQKTRVLYSFNTGIDTRTKEWQRTSAVQQAELYNRANPNSDPASWKWTQQDIDYIKTINNGWGYDLLQQVWRDPSTMTHNLNVSGGSEKIKYFVGGSYIKQNGFFPNYRYNKYNLRTNLTAKLTENLELEALLSLNNNVNKAPVNTGVGDIRGLYTWVRGWQPDYPDWTDNGLPIDIGWIANISAQLAGLGGYQNEDYLKPVANLSATYKVPFIDGLSLKGTFNKSYTNDRFKNFEKRYLFYATKKTGNHIYSTKPEDIISSRLSSQVPTDRLGETAQWASSYQVNFQINYNKTIANAHNIKALLVYEKYQQNGGGLSARIDGFPAYLTDQWWAASPNRQDALVSTNPKLADTTTGRKSWIGQVSYDYKGKYIANFSFRHDGSMNFAPDYRWGFFPSGSAAWIVSKESFFNNVKGISLLKLRGSVGLTGNDAVGGWQWQQSYVRGNSAYFGENPSANAGITYGRLPNKELTWEKSLTYDVGLDVEFLNNFNFTADYYVTHTYDILGQRALSLPPTYSLLLPDMNYAAVDAAGIDLTLGYNKTFGDFRLNTALIASYANANYKTFDDDKVTYDKDRRVGRSLSAVYGFYNDKILRTQQDVDDFVRQNPTYTYYGVTPELGQLVYKDISGPNGVPDGIIDDFDQTVIKNRNNPIQLGLSLGFEWKGLSVNAVFSGYFGYYRLTNDLSNQQEWNRQWIRWYDDSWTPENPNASLPKLLSVSDGRRTYGANSTFWLKRADFLRLRNVNIAYTIPEKLYNKWGINKFQIFLTGSNLFILSNFNKEYYDPEIDKGFPVMRSYNAGVSIQF